jgi:DNA-binding NarL/FixJ family response regulator
MHLEAGHRLRTNDAALVGEIDKHGHIDAPALDPAMLAHQASQIAAARSKRSPEASELWTALVGGRMSVIPRGDRYVVLENAPSSHRLRALTPSEVAVLALAARGTSTKQIAYALGVSPSLVSIRLRSAAVKVGVLSRGELVRLAALLAQDAKGLLDDSALTAAEQDVLDLLDRGYNNAEIARQRMRSVRTIANQVAAILRKTKSTSRRALLARRRPT